MTPSTAAGDASDRRAIIDLTIAYCWSLDTRQWDRLADVFLPDATANLGRTSHEGLDDIVARISTSLAKYTDSQHVVTTHQVVVDADEATCRCYLHAQHVAGEGRDATLLMVGGRYEDRLVRTAAGWRIAHRDLISMWTDPPS